MKCRLVNENFKSDYIRNLLQARGIAETDKYFMPTQDCLQDPLGLDNMERGAKLYHDVIEKGGRILDIVDCDNDGYTSGCEIYQYTKDIAPDIQIDYLLHEGKQHGLQDHIQTILDSDVHYDLIIIPDASSNDFKYHEMLKEINTPLLILDHHITDEELSDNAVIINNQLSTRYKNKELTGAGVVYQFCRYYDRTYGYNFADKYMDLAAWGIIGDMGGMEQLENRYIIYNGFKHINNKLLLALMHKQAYSITGKTAPTDAELMNAMNPISVAFYIVPLVNAMIRVGTMAEKTRLFEAFLDGDKMIPSGKRGEKGLLAKAGDEAARECSNARTRQNKLLDNAIDAIEAKIFKFDLLENRILFIRLDEDDTFPSELNGLVAMKLSAKYKRPTIVARLNDEGFDRGSMRGLNQSEVSSFKTFLEGSGLFEYVAGHDNAAGVSIPNVKLSEFHEYANNALVDVDFGENFYDVNFERIAADTDLGNLIMAISRHKNLWGQNNGEPLIHITDINISKSDVQIMGAKKDTVKFEKFGISYLKFRATDLIEQLTKYDKMKIEVVGRANLNEWCGRVTPQIFIEDIEIKEDNDWSF